MLEEQEEVVKIVDRYCLPAEDECAYIKIPAKEKDLVVELLSRNELTMKVFNSASEVFAEAVAEAYIKIEEEDTVDEDDNNISENLSVSRREELGEKFNKYLDTSSFMGDGLADIIDEGYREIVERVELEEASC